MMTKVDHFQASHMEPPAAATATTDDDVTGFGGSPAGVQNIAVTGVVTNGGLAALPVAAPVFGPQPLLAVQESPNGRGGRSHRPPR